MFQPGDKVVFTCDKAKAGQVVRLYGEVVAVGLCRVTIRTSDEQLHIREPEHVARYLVLPPNWEILFNGVCTAHQRSEVIASPLPKHLKAYSQEEREPALA